MSGMKGALKKTLVILILAVLTLAAFTVLSAPSVKAQTSDVKVLSYSWYVAPSNTVLAENSGDLIAVGEIQNVGTGVIGTVSIAGSAYASTGELLASNEGLTFITALLPGQKAPFYIDFTAESSITQDLSWVPYVSNVTVVVNYVSATNATQYSGLMIPNSSHSDSSGTYTVTGTVQNTGDETTGNVGVDATFYNGSGTVVAMNYTGYLTYSLAPGVSVPFTVTPTDNTAQLSSEITNYTLLIQSESLTASPTFTPSSSTSTTLTPSPTASTQTTQSPASASSGLTYAAVGAIVIVVVVLATLLLLRKRNENAQFEPPPPPPPPPPSL